MRKLALLLAVLVVSMTGVLVVGTPAHADTRSWSDRRDAGLALDIRKVRLANNSHRVNVQIKLQNFTAGNAERGGTQVWFDVDPSRKGPEFAASGGLGEGTDWTFGRVQGWGLAEIVHRCDLRLTNNVRSDSIRWTLGRGCFDARRGMRIGAEVSRYNPSFPKAARDYSPGKRRLHGWMGRG